MAVLVLVLLVGAALRLYRLPALPLGFHYDEAANGILAGEIASGEKLPVFIRAYTGKEVLFFYWASLWMRLVGPSTLAMRLSAAAVGLATVAAGVWSIRELLHGRRDARRIALLTGAFLATSFWHLVLSRYAFRAVTQPLLQALTVGTLWRGLRLSAPSRSPGIQEARGRLPRPAAGTIWLIASGLLCGLTAYTYLAARAFPVPVGAGLVALLVADKCHRRARLRQMAVFVGAAVVALAPLAYFWAANPSTFLNRTQQVAASTWGEAWDGLIACLGMLFIRGDPYIRFNIPGRPVFGPLMAALFLLGVIALVRWCIRRGRASRDGADPSPPQFGGHLGVAGGTFLLVCLPVMLLPSALAIGDVTPSNLRAVGLLPFVYVFPAIAVSAVASAVSRRAPRLAGPGVWVALVLATMGGMSAVAYFRDWAPSASLYYASDGDLVDVATYLNQAEGLSRDATFVASAHYRHPTLAFLAREYKRIRWLTGGRTLVFPAEREALLVIPRSAAKYLPWVESVLPADALVIAPSGPDAEPAFHVYRVPPGLTSQPSRSQAGNLANTALLTGYDVVGEPMSGREVGIAVWWRVLATPERGDLGPVARLTDAWGSTWGETSPFHYPGEQWRPGDVIVDYLSIPVGLGAPPGDYGVRFGLYSAQVGAGLPVLDSDGRYAGTWVELPVSLAPGDAAPASPDRMDTLLDRMGVRNRIGAEINGATLLGANLDLTSIRPGERVRVTLFWRVGATGVPDYTVDLALGEMTLYRDAPVHGTYPFSEWAAGQLVDDRYDPRLPKDTPPGEYALRLRLCESEHEGEGHEDASGDRRVSACALGLELGTVSVQAVERSFEVPSVPNAHTATLGQRVELLGYDLSAETALPGETVTLTLYWRALAEMSEDYTVFVHLLGPDGAIAGQHDGQPVWATYPTSLWMAGEVVVDVHEIAIRADAAPGTGWIEVGMYVADTGTRLGDAISGEGAVRLQPVTVGSP